jgi:hypothetical protein
MEVPFYTRRITEDGLFQIYDPLGNVLKTHLENDIPALSENCSRNLLEDLKQVNEKNRKLIATEKDPDEYLMKSLLTEGLGNELRESFYYCVLSTLTEAGNYEFPIDTFELKHDYFLDNIEDLESFPFGINEILIPFLKEEKKKIFGALEKFIHKDLLEEFVLAQIQEMKTHERCTLLILHNYFENFSLSIIVLWIKGAIREQHVVGAFWKAKYDIILPNIVETSQYEDARFLMNRMLYLKMLLFSYGWQDATLP